MRKKIDKRNELEQIIYSAIDMAEADGNEKVLTKARNMQEWLDDNFTDGTIEDFEAKFREMERCFNQ